MNIAIHHRAQGLVHQPVAFDGAQPCEGRRNDIDFEMTFAFFGAGVADVEMALVLYLELARVQGCRQAFAHLGNAGSIAHGSTGLKGFTVTFA